MFRSAGGTRIIVGALILIAIAAAFIAVGIYFIPGVDAQLPPSSVFDITIAEPYDDATIFLDDHVNIRVDTYTSGVPSGLDEKAIAELGNDHYELWIDGALVKELDGEAPALDKGHYAYTLWIPWQASEAGIHTLAVRGKNKYWNAASNVVHVNVIDPAAVLATTLYVPQNAETLSGIAQKFDVSPILLGTTNPDITSLEDPLSPDKPVLIPLIPNFEPIVQNLAEEDSPDIDQGGDSEPPAPPINKVALWLELNVFSQTFLRDDHPVAPTLFRFKEGCDVTFYIRDNSKNELGFYLYRLDPASTAFKRIATFGPHSGDKFIEFTDANLFGKYQYYAAAFNASGESADGFMSVDFSDISCIEPSAGEFRLGLVNLTLDVPAEKAYCYYSLQKDDWSRLPADPNTFFYSLNNTFNLSSQLSTLRLSSGTSLSVECWGWSGGSLIFLGSGESEIELSPTQVNLRGDQFSITGDLLAIGSYPDPVLMDIKKKVIVRPPENLEATSNIDVCISHFPLAIQGFFGPLFCKSALENGNIILVWEWRAPLFPIDDATVEEATVVDGYYVYKYYPGGKPVLIKTINDPAQKVLIQPAESSLKLPVYFVRAFRNIHVSGDSNHYPLTTGGSAALVSVSIPATPHSENEISYFTDWTEKLVEDSDCGVGLAKAALEGLSTDQVAVGFEHRIDNDCLDLYDTYYRGSVLFDLDPVKGPVSKAIMTYVQGKTISDEPGTYSTGGQSCADSLNITTGISTGGVESFDPYRTLTRYGFSGFTHTVDVTEAARDWVAGSPNLGFVLTGRDEGFPENNDVCWSRYKWFVLEVTYFDLSK